MLDFSAGLNLNSPVRDKAESPIASTQPVQFGKKTARAQRGDEVEPAFGQELAAQSVPDQSTPIKAPIPQKGFDEVKPTDKWQSVDSKAGDANFVPKETLPEWPVGVQGAGEVDPLTRRSAMLAFIRKMEDELGISATDIVAAFSKLSAEDLLAPPEQSIGKVLDQMGLEGEDRTKALLYFEEMMKKSASSNMAEYLKGNNQQLSLEVLSKSEARKKRINDSVDRMSQSFFVNPATRQQAAASQSGKVVAGAAGAGIAAQSLWGAKPGAVELAANSSIGAQDLAQWMNGQAGNGSEVLNASPEATSGQPLPQGFEGMALAAPAQPATDELLVAEDGMSSLSEAEGATSSAASGLSVENLIAPLSLAGAMEVPEQTSQALDEILKSANFESSTAATEAKAEGASIAGLAADNKDPQADDSQPGLDSQVSGDPAQSLGNQAAGKTGNTPFFVPGAPKMTENQEAQNVRNVVDQAQVMVRNGGGEMKVKLNPEGVGEVTLKVVSDGGRVSVEMIASNADTKRMLERGLADLRETLASHKLNVDHVKVGSLDQTSKQMDQQMQDQQSRFAQQFMEDFRRENQAWRQGFIEMPGVRNYRSQAAEGSGTTGITPQQSSPKRPGRQLDLVA